MTIMQYAKAIVTAIGAGLAIATTYYPHAGWIPAAIAGVTVLATWAVPNTAPKSIEQVLQQKGTQD